MVEWALVVLAGNLGYYIARQSGAPLKGALIALALAWLVVLLPGLQEVAAPQHSAYRDIREVIAV